MYKKRMRLPNGFGQISELKGRNLRNPFRAMVTVGKDEKGKPICKPLKPNAYFRTYNEAYVALIEYNKSPYDLESDITMQQLFDKWSERYFQHIQSDSGRRIVISAWKYCSSIYDTRVVEVRQRHIKSCIEEGYVIRNDEKVFPSADTKSRMKAVFNNMLDYAVEFELVDKNYARAFIIDKNITKERRSNSRHHIPYTDEEFEILWNNVDTIKYVDMMLVQCYSGWRPQELCMLRLENISLEDWTFRGGMKTEAGTNRIVPIHSKIRDLVVKRYEYSNSIGSEFLFPSLEDGQYMTYDKYKSRYQKVKNQLKLNPEHRPHDGRVHFITQAKKYNVDEYAIKYIVGHTIADITERVYTHRELEWLKNEIEKIK